MKKDMQYYPIKQLKNNTNVEEKFILGEVYNRFFGIQPAKTMKRDLCFQITHIPSGHLLTCLYFSKVIDAKRYIDWFIKETELEKFKVTDVDKLYFEFANSSKVKKQKVLEKKYGDKAIVFEV